MRNFTIPVALALTAVIGLGSAHAQQFAFLQPPAEQQLAPQVMPQAPQDQYQDQYQDQDSVAPQNMTPDGAPVIGDENAELPPRLQRQIVAYAGHEPAGTIIVDTPHTYLYYVLGDGHAIRYGIGVGREGFTWSGVRSIARKAEWPDWYPPQSMIARQPYLPRMTAGGPGNPLGARALYIGGTEYRIHGTNDPSSIGKFMSSGCIRLTNDNIIDLYNRVQIGAKVVVLPKDSTVQIEPPHASHRNARIETAGPRLATSAQQPSGLY
ncbi:MAG: L,D-transpeptidase [Pseudolabrys sp.]|jgi:lipoprotein-anchoring transpeptidase ErfK/SrfK|nr:L,D-transpeptidase [Pseudolabrys sp.]